MISTLFYFFLALILLVTVHEYGHFLIARLCGVKVLRFSFGFGKILARWRDKKGTEYAFSAFPLGGYVKMLDETEEPVPVDQRHLAFNRQSLWKKTAIVIAGPLFNFIFAFAALWLVAVIGMNTLAPMIDDVRPGSIAAKAGIQSQQEIIAVGGTQVISWRDVQYALMPYIGSDEAIEVKLKSLKNHQITTVHMPLASWELDNKKPDVLKSLGLVPFIPSIPPVVGEIVADSPASQSDLMINDRIIKMNGKPIDDWLYLVDYVKKHPGEALDLQVDRNGQLKDIQVTLGRQDADGQVSGFLGVRSKKADWPEHWLRVERASFLQAVPLALKQTAHLTRATVILMGRLVSGQLSLNNISGPVGIAQGAGNSGRGGFVYYLSFLALVSISLGVLNLLPIPMLDGGHLLFYLIEAIRRKPLTDEFKSAGMYLGLALMVVLMVLSLFNDISRLSS